MSAPCPYRAMCEGMRQVSCRDSAKEIMRDAIEACAGGECFAIFGVNLKNISDEEGGKP